MEITEADGFLWRLTEFHGEPRTKRRFFLGSRCVLSMQRDDDHGFVLGLQRDFFGAEKDGGPPRAQVYKDQIREVLEDCDLVDLGLEGDPYTWHNNSHTSKEYIHEKLDQAVASGEWAARFNFYPVRNGESRHSDHRPMIVTQKQ